VKTPEITPPLAIESLDNEGRGVAHRDGKAVFVEGALPGERVRVAIVRRKPSYEFGTVDTVLRPSAMRVEPRCPHFGVCGGCSLQHMEPGAQVAAKQRALEDALWHIGRVRAGRMLPPVYGPAWEYRHRARLTVRYVPKKGGVLVGFHERRSSYVADMTSCAVLPRRISELLVPLRRLVEGLSLRERLPQIELAIGDDVDVLVLRILQPLNADDDTALRAFADRHGIQFYVQPGGPDTVAPFHPSAPRLSYSLPDFGLRFEHSPTEFTQVNAAVNRVLVRKAIGLLDPRPGERIADFFCGLGNFSLPIAVRGARVVGIEGAPALVERARANARANGLEDRAGFRGGDLFATTADSLAALGRFDRMLVDPPREGALALVRALDADAAARIVYVSCNPATLARDAAVLVHEKGFGLRAAGVVNMFPHTAHVESVAVFEPAAPAAQEKKGGSRRLNAVDSN
jgi:23S rRNA (uracil1939-C5)-methyltransferase